MYLFVATLLIVVGLVVATLMLNGEREEWRSKFETASEKLKQEQNQVRNKVIEVADLQKLIAGTSEGWPGNEFFVGRLREVEDQLNDLKKKLDGTANLTYPGLVDPYKDFGIFLKRLHQALEEETEKAKTAVASHEKLRETTEEQLKELDNKNTALRTQLTDKERQMEDSLNAQSAKIAELTATLAKAQEDATENEIRLKKELVIKDNEKQQLQVRLKRYEDIAIKDKNVEDIEPDGQIVNVESRTRLAWLNLGVKNHLRPGLTFRVFQYVGGKKHWKGAIEVSRVEQSFSEARIVEERDSLNPITASDYITSPFYDPKVVPVFVLAGDKAKTPGVSKEYIERRLKDFGAKVSNEVKVDTDFLVALENFETTPEYQTARQLSVAIIRETDLMDYLGR
jgi:NAD-dependent DNA ligase